MKNLVIDLDGTLTIDDKNVPYEDKKVNQKILEQLRIYKKMGFKITIFTSRNMKTYKGDIEKIKAKTLPKIKIWLEKNRVIYDELIVGKPWCGDEGFYVDDKAVRPFEFSTLKPNEISKLISEKNKTVLITSAKYSSDEFTLEFGKIVPSFLPLGNKRLYEYQAKLFKDYKIFLSLPKDFKISSFDLNKLKNLGIKPLFVPKNLSLGESVVYCMNLIDGNELYIIHGDTFFKELELIPNSLVVTQTKDNYNWAYLDKDFKITLNEESILKEKLILAGAFHIQNTHLFIKSIVQNKYSFIKGLKAYSRILPFEISKNDSWLDFGLLTSYFHSKKTIQTQRVFNNLSYDKWGGGFVQKNSSWLKKIEAEILWFENLPKELWNFIPKFFRGEGCYFTEYLYNNTLAELFVFGKLPTPIWKKIFTSLKTFLDKLHSFKSENLVLNFDYKAKTLQRLEEFSKQSGIELHQKWQLENTIFPPVLELVERLDKYLKNPKFYTLIHGDFCFSNIMYDFRANCIKTFDPRGMDFSETFSNFGDKNYDLAKLVHSIFGYYDFIIAGFYSLKIKNNIIKLSFSHSNEFKDIQKSFLEIFKPNKEIFALNIHLFLSMLPLHKDSKERQMAFLANALRLFGEFFKEEL